MSIMRGSCTLTWALALMCLAVRPALAEQKQQLVFKVDAANTKYTQQYTIDVDDVPGHQVRLFEIRRTYPSNAPAINGMKIVRLAAETARPVFEPRKRLQIAGYLSETGKRRFASNCVVGLEGLEPPNRWL